MTGFYVYILASGRNGSLYIGMTNDIVRRVFEHREGLADGHTRRYGIKTLVYMEEYPTSQEAIHREKCLKRWKRDWKIELIEAENPRWRDLYNDFAK
jgi:putative endonuclease